MLPAGASARFVDLPGLRMHLVEAGPADGIPVLLLHGFPEFWYSWRFQIPALAAAGYRVCAPDLRGYNRTETRGPYDLGTLMADIVHLQDALGWPAAHIVGHDWGGVLAWPFAAAHPARTRSITAMNGPHLSAYLDACLRGRQILKSWYVGFFQIPRLAEWALRRNHGAALRKVFHGLPPERMTPDDLDRYVEAMLRPGCLSAAIGWYRALPRAVFRRGGAMPNPRITVPACVIWGARDHALDAACNTTLPRYAPDLTMHILPRATHWVQMDDPAEVNARLLEFLGAH
jgi:pimeloyl-ACP methyl ester carboxylesterase